MAAKKKAKLKTPVASKAPDVSPDRLDECGAVSNTKEVNPYAQNQYLQEHIYQLEKRANRFTSVKLEQMKKASQVAYEYFNRLNTLISAIESNPSIEKDVNVPSYPDYL